MKTSTISEKSIDNLTTLINAVPTVPLNHTAKFNIIYDSTGNIIKDIKLIPKDSFSAKEYSVLELSVNSQRKISRIKVQTIIDSGYKINCYIKAVDKTLEPHEKNNFDYWQNIKLADREYLPDSEDKKISDTIKAYNALH